MLGRESQNMSMRPADRPEHQTIIALATQEMRHVKTTLSKALPERAKSKVMEDQPSFPAIASTKAVPNLQLPSFDFLGIGAPHPDRTEYRQEQVDGEDNLAVATAGSLYFADIDMSPRCDSSNCNALGLLDGVTTNAVHRGHLPSVCVLTLTPPADEKASLNWDSSIDSNLERRISTTPSHEKESSGARADAPSFAAALSGAGESSIPRVPEGASEKLDTNPNATNSDSRPGNDADEGIERASWLDESIRTLGENIIEPYVSIFQLIC